MRVRASRTGSYAFKKKKYTSEKQLDQEMHNECKVARARWYFNWKPWLRMRELRAKVDHSNENDMKLYDVVVCCYTIGCNFIIPLSYCVFLNSCFHRRYYAFLTFYHRHIPWHVFLNSTTFRFNIVTVLYSCICYLRSN